MNAPEHQKLTRALRFTDEELALLSDRLFVVAHAAQKEGGDADSEALQSLWNKVHKCLTSQDHDIPDLASTGVVQPPRPSYVSFLPQGTNMWALLRSTNGEEVLVNLNKIKCIYFVEEEHFKPKEECISIESDTDYDSFSAESLEQFREIKADLFAAFSIHRRAV